MSFSVPTGIIKSSYYTCYIHLRSFLFLRRKAIVETYDTPLFNPISLLFPCALSPRIPITMNFYFNFALNSNLILNIIYSYFNTKSYF